MMTLSPTERNRLLGLLGMLGSDFPGERANAGSLATKLIRDRGLTWGELMLPALSSDHRSDQRRQPPGEGSVRLNVRFCQLHLDKLNSWEREFIRSLSERCKFTDGQVAKLKQIAADLRMRGCA